MVPRISFFNRMKMPLVLLSMTLAAVSCSKFTTEPVTPVVESKKPFLWDNANVYFLITDRFNNGNPGNDFAYGRKADAAPLRGFAGGDLAGVTAKIKSGYFDKLGINVIWTTPVVEQIHAGTDEGTGKSYGFHGYWTRDWTRVDANLGTEEDMREFVETAHAHGIRVLMDVVINHTGPVTEVDPVWPDSWVRTAPACTYKDPKTTIECTLVKNLPDIRTDSNANVELPPALVAKWKAEGRYEREVQELNEFFAKTGYPRAPRFYIMKWHADWIKKYGIDGFRVDTAKHTEPAVWKELNVVASAAFTEWQQKNPGKKFNDDPFFMTGEVYGYGIGHEKKYDMGAGTYVNFFDYGFNSLINFSLVYDIKKSYEELFSDYSARLNGSMAGYSVLNYIASHDDGNSYDRERMDPLVNATKLLLSPGAAQIYYGDETSRELRVANATGDAQLRSFMNWDELANNVTKNGFKVADVHNHWSKLALFRAAHPSIGAGVHKMLQAQPYTFTRTYHKNGISDKVVVALDIPSNESPAIDVQGVFNDGQKVRDFYSGNTAVVKKGKVKFASTNSTVLIEQL